MRDRSNRTVRPKMFAIACLLAVTALAAVGCTGQQIADLQAGVDAGEQVYSATTQATAKAKAAASTMPASTPGLATARRVIADSETSEQAARAALDVVNAALVSLQNKDQGMAQMSDALRVAIAAVPSPWSPLAAALVPALVPLGYSLFQSRKIGQMAATVAANTQDLQTHKAALDALGAPTAAATPAPPTPSPAGSAAATAAG